MYKQENKLKVDPEDIEDVLKLVEKSYNIEFKGNELANVRTFGQLTDHIISKIKLEDKDDCTDQQAFYKLRTAILEVRHIDKSTLTPKSKLTDIFPRGTRIKEIKEIENKLELDLQALRAHYFVTISILIFLIASIAGLFIDKQYGLIGICISIFGFWIAGKTGKEFNDNTLGELVDRLTQLNYTKSRRHLGTVNTKEIQGKIQKLFVDNLGLENNEINRDTVIV